MSDNPKRDSDQLKQNEDPEESVLQDVQFAYEQSGELTYTEPKRKGKDDPNDADYHLLDMR
ncbi:hypothetical protein GXN76_13340 [Kroppenstedtia pulmonis]|uniref:DUF4025 domain-containing protein n=1 Tax=Kroppenstedtia pulmonis TaxID=1380685 RepID=A0A7D3XRP4_9BACL|nr:hypothetical protein [Kroppenstedtia pulmonis]QKG85362.1 hypothetical protein GXN76_13340 [Kroppenstedtia pulmonis]